MNANEEIIAGNTGPIYMMQPNLNTVYADSDADLCVRVMSLCVQSPNTKNRMTLCKVKLYIQSWDISITAKNAQIKRYSTKYKLSKSSV